MTADTRMWCRRYPRAVEKHFGLWCGEWARDSVPPSPEQKVEQQ
jgi:hypothetical protein